MLVSGQWGQKYEMEGNLCVRWCWRENTFKTKVSSREKTSLNITSLVLDVGALHGQDGGSSAWRGVVISPLPKAGSPTCQGSPALHPAPITPELQPDLDIQLQLDAHL